MSKKTIRESLLSIDKHFLGTDKYKDLTTLYESQDISGKDKVTLKKLINDIKNKEDLQDAIMSILQEEVDDDLDEGYFRIGSIPLEDDVTLQLFNLFAAEGYDTNSPEVDAYISSVAPIIEDDIKHFRKDDDYNVRVWYEETKRDYPEELAKLPKSTSLKEDINFENNQMIIEIISGISGDRLIISIISNNEIVFKEEYIYGYNASYSKEFKNSKAPYINDIITDLCDQYNISRQNIQVIPGKNTFKGTKISDNVINDFIKNHLPLEESLNESDTLNDDEFDYFAVYEGDVLQGEYPTYFDAKENCKGSSCTIKGVKQYGPHEYEETPLNEDYNTNNYEIKSEDDFFYIDIPYDLDYYIDIPYQLDDLPNNLEDVKDEAEKDFYYYITNNKICSKISEICNMYVDIDVDDGVITVFIDKDSVDNSKESINVNLLYDTLSQLVNKWECTDEIVIWGTQRDADDWDEYYGEFSAKAYL